ncbi:DUF6303 family protein [Kitasatospora sp. NPDC004614]|uniref:DUF6303 family protein n=1 Tax=unclassified Kitasatospora TaxID=2633591 RepID=UPI0036A0FE85
MTTPTYRTVLSSRGGDSWRLFVALPGRVADWPDAEFPGAAIPTIRDRDAALEELGYRLAAGADWDWWEDTDTDGRVTLLASTWARPA